MEPGMDAPSGPTKSKKRRSSLAINNQNNQVNLNQLVNQSPRGANSQGALDLSFYHFYFHLSITNFDLFKI